MDDLIEYAASKANKPPSKPLGIGGRVAIVIAILIIATVLFIVLYVAVFLTSLGPGNPMDH